MKARIPQGAGGAGNMNQMMQRMQKMQEEMTRAQAELEEKVYHVSAGGGNIEVEINGKKEVTSVTLKPEVVDPDDIEFCRIRSGRASMRPSVPAPPMQSRPLGPLPADWIWACKVAVPRKGENRMDSTAAPLQKLIEQFARLPGVGRKMAQRFAFLCAGSAGGQGQGIFLRHSGSQKQDQKCSVCGNFTEGELCPICSAKGRDTSLICVVEDPRDVLAFERTREYNGVYHVLHGLISPWMASVRISSPSRSCWPA